MANAQGRSIGYSLRDGQGKLLRRFVDSNANGVMDQWSYYQDGFEVYRETDLNDDKSLDESERLIARLKMAEIPRNGNPTRIRNRCELTGRPRSHYRKNKLSRSALRELGSKGLVPGLVKSSW